MTIPIPAIFDFELHATVLGHPATVALRRVQLGTMHWYSYEYRISPTTTRTVVADTPTAILFVAMDALAAGSYPKLWRWQADLPPEKEPRMYDIEAVEAHLLIGPAVLDRSLYDEAIQAVAGVQERIRAGVINPCEQYTRRDLRPEVAAALLESGPGSLVVDFLEIWRDLTLFDHPGVLRDGAWTVARHDPSDHTKVIIAVALASEHMERTFVWPAFVGLYAIFRIVTTF
jgi:hypothetical protein